MPSYAISDIHGCYHTFIALLDKIHFSPASDTLYILGDVIDRGPNVAHLVNFLIDLKKKYPHHVFLLGNHEDLLIRAIMGHHRWVEVWLANGGYTTVAALSIKLPPYSSQLSFLESMPEEYLAFFLSMKLFHQTSTHFMVHASLCWHSWDILADREHLLWNRHHRVEPSKINNKVLIHGHTPIPLHAILSQPPTSKIFNIDGGCVYAPTHPELGYLIALRLDDHTFFYQYNIDVSQ